MVNEFIDISKKLKTILSEFNGAQGNSEEKKAKSLMSAFQQIAGKLLYGGHFVVTDENGGVIRRVFLHTVEFYYHEENEKMDSCGGCYDGHDCVCEHECCG